MPATIIDGSALAEAARADLRARTAGLRERHRPVRLVALMVGATEAGELYAQRQRETCEAVGIDYELRKLESRSGFDEVAAIIESLNEDTSVTGIMLHLPLPKQLDATEL